jgi:signal transduction histidine kinase
MTDNGHEKIIIIDDERRMCESLAALLTGDGYSVQTFQQSQDAIEVIRRERVDLVVTDIKMPNMDGMEILRQVKEVDEGIPVILMTGFASLDTAIDAVALGAYDYLLKPVEFSHFELAVNRALDKRRSDLARLQLLEELKLSNLILQRRINELNALYEAGKSIGSAANLKELLRQIVALASSVTDARVGSIMLLDDRDENLTIEAAIGLEQEVIDSTVLPVGESIAGYVAQHGEPLVVEDVESDERFRRTSKERYGQASLLSAPLKIKNRIIGVINMANKEGGGVFNKNDLRLLTTFASQAAVVVDDANQFEKNRRRLVEFEILHEIAEELPQIQSMNDFRNTLLDKLRRVFDIDFAVWLRWESERERLIVDGGSGVPDLPLTDSGGIDISATAGEAITIPNFDPERLDLTDVDVLSDSLSAGFKDSEHFPKPDDAFMAIPIMRTGELAFILCLGSDSPKPFSEDDLSLARLVVSQAAYLFEKEKALLNATRLMTMGNMISEISHDLRKPLTSLRGGLQIIRQRWPEVAGKSEFFQIAEDEIHRMNELVRELVDFSNPNKYQTSKVDLREVVHRASELIKPDLKKHKIEFSTEYDDARWEVVINRNQILEALLNILMNSIDAMPEGGTLKVIGKIEKPEHKKQNYLALKIVDTGYGIRKENLSKIFDRYYTTKETGTGLGLAVVERIISAHDGTLRVESEEGKGTTFSVYFQYIT